jgi:hypothetical protein
VPDVLTDPVGVVVKLVASVEPALEPAAVEGLVRGVAAGRAKRRRLAQALLDKPSLLADGRSPAPRVVGDLLIALRNAGAVSISPPRCATCGKHLRTLQRRGDNWYCGVCGPKPEPCAACGSTRRVATRDRDGRPRCHRCPPDHGDPIELAIAAIAAVDPTIPAETVAAAVQAVTSGAGQRRQLAWALHDRPELLTGAGAEAGVPSVLRLIDELCEAGATRIVRPACPGCGRVIRLVKPRKGVRLCRNCVAKSRAESCARCGVVREPATRDRHGRPLCPYCLITDPANQEICVGCGRCRPVSVRSPGGPLCQRCRPVGETTCSICGRFAACETSRATGQPWCRACQQRWARCARCGQVKPIKGGTAEEPWCATCTRPDPSFWDTCPACGETAQLRSGPCARCALRKRLRQLLGGSTGEIRPELRALYDNLAGIERPASVLGWLDKSDATAVLRELASGERPLTHEALDELPEGKPLEHLRSMLVATGALPPRDEQMARLERWVTRTIAGREDPDEKRLLHRYAVWHLVRRLRGRTNGRETTHSQAAVVQQHVRAAIGLLDWLTERRLTLASCRQEDLDAWLASDDATHRREAGHFVRWAAAHKLTSLELPAVRWGGPSGVIDAESRWEQARWLLGDDTLKPEDRVAGLLVLLYAQWPAVISRLTLRDIEISDNEVRLRLGREPVVVPEPLAALLLDLVASRRGHAALGDEGTSPWLFPGGRPGRPISADRLAERLRQLGLRPGQARSTALFQLATELPAAVLARMLGIHVGVAVQWQRACGGDWAAYAADYSRRGEVACQEPTPEQSTATPAPMPPSPGETPQGVNHTLT